jgi:death-on-curing protein
VTEWLSITVVLAIHDAQIAEHGGSDGVRDMGALESAIARPQHLEAYGAAPDLAAMAAALAYGIAQNHGFVDGNKRTSAVATETFLELNGATLTATDAEIVETWSELGAGKLSEDALADWIRARLGKAVLRTR